MDKCERKVTEYLSFWRGIRSLRELENDELKEFWEQIDDTVEILTEDLNQRDDLPNQFPLVTTVVIEMIRLGEFIRVEAVATALFKAAQRVSDQLVMIRSQVFLGYVYFNLAEFRNAYDAFTRGLSMLGSEIIDQVRRVVFLSNLSMVAAETEDLQRAAGYAHDALKIIDATTPAAFNYAAQRAGTPDHAIQRSAVTSNLGALYQEMGTRETNPIKREELFSIATKYSVHSSVGKIPLSDRVRARANRGSTMLYQGKAKESYALFRRLDKRCQNNHELTRMRAWIQGFMSEAALQLGNVDESIRHCHLSMRLAIQSADPIRETETMRIALKPLKAISGEIFGGSHTNQRFLEKGMPVIMELLDFLEDKDWYTAQAHSHGVSRIALKLFDVLIEKYPNIKPESDRNTLEIASLLHDIGKLWIPWGILNRITPLWDREFDIIRQHPGQGRLFLEELGFARVGDIIGRHHERPDGAGYPNGGDIGGIAGRILAVADCFEAMTTPNRLYRRPLSKETAVQKMISQAGQQFDETVVNALPDAVMGLV